MDVHNEAHASKYVTCINVLTVYDITSQDILYKETHCAVKLICGLDVFEAPVMKQRVH